MEKKEYLVLSRGQWDSTARKEDVEAAITKFYDWITDHITHGRMKPGSRLNPTSMAVPAPGLPGLTIRSLILFIGVPATRARGIR